MEGSGQCAPRRGQRTGGLEGIRPKLVRFLCRVAQPTTTSHYLLIAELEELVTIPDACQPMQSHPIITSHLLHKNSDTPCFGALLEAPGSSSVVEFANLVRTLTLLLILSSNMGAHSEGYSLCTLIPAGFTQSHLRIPCWENSKLWWTMACAPNILAQTEEASRWLSQPFVLPVAQGVAASSPTT